MNDETKERLVDIIDDYIHDVDVKEWYSEELDEGLANYLIEEGGVIVPLCKVGDTVYFIENEQVRCGEVVEMRRYKDPEVIAENSPIQEIYYVNSAVISFPMGCSELTPYTRDDFGKIAFLTKEQAYKALKEGADSAK